MPMFEKIIVKPDAKSVTRMSKAGKEYTLQDQVRQLFDEKGQIQAMTTGQYFVNEPLSPGDYQAPLSMVYDRDGKIAVNNGEPVPMNKPKAA